MLEVQTKAPNFTLCDQDGKEHSLSDYLGKKVILYFYSKDNTAGCTKEACAFKDAYPTFQEKDAVVIGISKDTSTSHRKFVDKYELPFILLADPDKEVLNAYDVYKEKTMYGKKVMGTVRSTYVINEEGIITHAFTKVKPDLSASQVLEVL